LRFQIFGRVEPTQLREEVWWSRRSATGKHGQPPVGHNAPFIGDKLLEHNTTYVHRSGLHEIAHYLCRCEPAHGPELVAAFCELTDAVMGPEVGHVLRVTYAKEGVR